MSLIFWVELLRVEGQCSANTGRSQKQGSWQVSSALQTARLPVLRQTPRSLRARRIAAIFPGFSRRSPLNEVEKIDYGAFCKVKTFLDDLNFFIRASLLGVIEKNLELHEVVVFRSIRTGAVSFIRVRALATTQS